MPEVQQTVLSDFGGGVKVKFTLYGKVDDVRRERELRILRHRLHQMQPPREREEY